MNLVARMMGRFMPWTLAFSLAAHAAALLLLPGLARQAESPFPALVANLRRLPAAAPSAPLTASPSAAEAARRLPPALPRPAPAERKAAPPSTASTRSKALASAAPARTEPFTALAPDTDPGPALPAPGKAAGAERALREESTPAPVAAAPAAATILAGPRDGVALDDYGRALADLLSHQQQYPRLAALRGWEGEVRLRLKVARKGNLVAVQVVHSSGHEVLDQHALQLVQGTALPHPPDALGEGEIQVIVPIHYKLQKPT